jgi:hypothetical protein
MYEVLREDDLLSIYREKQRQIHGKMARPLEVDVCPCGHLVDCHDMGWLALEVEVSINHQLCDWKCDNLPFSLRRVAE